jgi:hypothetical protein
MNLSNWCGFLYFGKSVLVLQSVGYDLLRKGDSEECLKSPHTLSQDSKEMAVLPLRGRAEMSVRLKDLKDLKD